jgi:hypothetical protein
VNARVGLCPADRIARGTATKYFAKTYDLPRRGAIFPAELAGKK